MSQFHVDGGMRPFGVSGELCEKPVGDGVGVGSMGLGEGEPHPGLTWSSGALSQGTLVRSPEKSALRPGPR